MNNYQTDIKRYTEFKNEEEYLDLLIPHDFYRDFQADVAQIVKKYIIEHCQNLSVIDILEAGSGTGVTTLELLKVDPRIRVVAVENEIDMLKISTAKFKNIPEMENRVTFVHADIVDFLESEKDQKYDVFASLYTLHNFAPEKRIKVVELIAKKIKSNGLFVNGDKYAQNENHEKDFAAEIENHNKFDELAAIEDKAGNSQKAAYWRGLKAEGVQHAHQDNDNRITVKEQTEILEGAGFDNIVWGKRYHLVTTVNAVKK